MNSQQALSRDDAGFGGALRELGRVATYPRIGYQLRELSWSRSALDVDLTGKVCIVTGASRGLGFAAARGLAQRGATVVLLCRDPARGGAARRDIVAAVAPPDTASRVVLELCDVASLASVRAFAARFLERFARLDVLINNAGVLHDRRLRSADGHELTFATNVLGGFQLTRLLLPALLAAAPSRIIHAGSAALLLQRLDVEAMMSSGGAYSGELVYARSKRALAELNTMWAEKLRHRGVTSNLMHPGLTATPGVERTFPRYLRWFGPLLRDLDQGADTLVWLAAARAVAHETGSLWFDREARPAHVVPWTRCSDRESQRLWDTCSSLCGLPPELDLTS